MNLKAEFLTLFLRTPMLDVGPMHQAAVYPTEKTKVGLL
jgi:hypothetical protein